MVRLSMKISMENCKWRDRHRETFFTSAVTREILPYSPKLQHHQRYISNLLGIRTENSLFHILV